jgi:hypothetical protein
MQHNACRSRVVGNSGANHRLQSQANSVFSGKTDTAGPHLNVCFWHLADMKTVFENVCFGAQSRLW